MAPQLTARSRIGKRTCRAWTGLGRPRSVATSPIRLGLPYQTLARTSLVSS